MGFRDGMVSYKALAIFLCFGGGLIFLAVLHNTSVRTGTSFPGMLSLYAHGLKPITPRHLTTLEAASHQVDTEPLRVPMDCRCAEAPHVVLAQPTSNSIGFRLLSDFASTVSIIWAEEGTNSLQRTDPLKLTPSKPSKLLLLSNLKMSTRYTYQLFYENSVDCGGYYSATGFFHTQRSFGEDFTFAIIADTHFGDLDGGYDAGIFAQTRTNMVSMAHSSPGYDFVFDLGDTFMGEKLEPPVSTLYKLYEDVFKEISPLACSAPLFLINGNHDGEIGGNLPKKGVQIESSLPVTFARLRNTYFSNPAPGNFYSGNKEIAFKSVGLLKNYYAWNWGNSFFAVLDPYWNTLTHVHDTPWEWTLGKNQYDWLNEALEHSPSTLKFIFTHQLVGGVFGTKLGFGGGGDESFLKYFEWGGLDHLTGEYAFGINRPGWEHGPIHEIFVRNKVSVVFRGHDHLYHLGQLDGIFYNTLPKTSAKEFGKSGWIERGYASAESVLLTSGHTEVQVSQTNAVVSLRSSVTNELLHQYTVYASAAVVNDHLL